MVIPFRGAAPFGLIMGLILVLLIACGDESATTAPTATAPASSTIVTISPTTPTATVAPAPSPMQTLTPTPAPPPTPTQAPSPTVSPLPSPTAEPALAATITLDPLTLEVTFPSRDMVVDTSTITVTGITSPDATVSVNGYLAAPDVAGRFAVDVTIVPWENPLAIEIIATSLTGESRSLVRTVIYIP
ncbi:MAG: hypothetical protein IIB30_06325 [Chloroflexi bacterium]|nr:hypothetical protein [Chloroflexota bacterium]